MSLGEIRRPESSRSSSSASTRISELGDTAHDAISLLKQLIEERRDDVAVDQNFQELTTLICTSFNDLGAQTVECEDCGELFRSMLDRMRHVEIAHGGPPKGHHCSICQKSFNSAINLTRHRRKDHSTLSEIKFCSFCNLEVFESIHIHNKSHHPHACFPCKTDFQSPRERALHDSLIHNKKHICRTCWRAFSEKNNLYQHELDSHKVFCAECPQKFFTSEKALEAHRAAKHVSRPGRVSARRSL